MHSFNSLDLKHPLQTLELWLNEALSKNLEEPTAMCLSTASKAGKPSSRLILCKEITDTSIIFYSNYSSRKGRDLEENPLASATFFWKLNPRRQVHLSGEVRKTSKIKSNFYWKQRPKSSQISQFLSYQSQCLGEKTLESLYSEATKKFKDQDVPRPKSWGGYELIPTEIEFWLQADHRLHQRIQLTLKNKNQWVSQQLYP